MRFNPCVWRYDNLKGWSPQRIAAAKRAVAKEQARVAALRAEVALFPEMQAEIQPAFATEEERMTAMDRRELHITREFRDARAGKWREARRMYFALPPMRREGARRLWNTGLYPADPAYFSEMIRKFLSPCFSPWTHLRKKRLCWLWARGILPKPANALALTSAFESIGTYRTQRLPFRRRSA